MIELCLHNKVIEAGDIMHNLYHMGYSPEDIVSNMFKVCKVADVPEYLKLEYIKVICPFIGVNIKIFNISGNNMIILGKIKCTLYYIIFMYIISYYIYYLLYIYYVFTTYTIHLLFILVLNRFHFLFLFLSTTNNII